MANATSVEGMKPLEGDALKVLDYDDGSPNYPTLSLAEDGTLQPVENGNPPDGEQPVNDADADGQQTQPDGQPENKDATQKAAPVQTPATQSKPAEKVYKTQKDVDKAWAAREKALKAEMDKQYGQYVTMSAEFKALFPGKTPDQIMESLTDTSAAELAAEKNIPLEIAKELVQTRRMVAGNGMPVQTQPAKQQSGNARTEALAAQVEDILAVTEGKVDMAQVLAQNPDIAAKVLQEGVWDINRAYIEYQHRGGGTQTQPEIPEGVVRSANGARAAAKVTYTKQQFDAIKNAVREGNYVTLPDGYGG